MDHHHAVRHPSSSLDIYSEPLYQRPGRKQEQQTYNSEMKTAFFSKLRPTVENTTISLVFKVYLIYDIPSIFMQCQTCQNYCSNYL